MATKHYRANYTQKKGNTEHKGEVQLSRTNVPDDFSLDDAREVFAGQYDNIDLDSLKEIIVSKPIVDATGRVVSAPPMIAEKK